ncbi:MAG: hypothetical protein E6K81_14865 [Candidatus Eisenbacteria bacterium]|uniref:DUF3859 domain-containing protein n=1 Tax=Eiseniibacteriota bacterium TaxID=2212470 RepID=A0A538U0T2_UNCEI|nr:MAG: hypothetical protein E6K81_14865 [Candidatus Eisenbacteria bacterium]
MKGHAPGKLAVFIAASDSTAFIDEWTTATYKHPVAIRGIHEIARGKTAHIAFIVTGHSPGSDGRSHVDIDVCVRRPDGSVAYQEAAYGRLARRNDGQVGFVMADPTLEFGVDQTDPLGPWRIEAVAHDRVRGTQATAIYLLTVRK